MKKILLLLVCATLIGSGFFFFKEPKTPTISVVMPVHNRPDLLIRAADSILNQTEKDFEFVIIDDGSNEETKKVLKEYEKKDKRVKVYPNPKNRGIAYSRQRGLELAKGTYIAIMDSDDWSVPNRLEKSIAFMKDHPEIDAVTGNLETINEKEFIPNYTYQKEDKYQDEIVPGLFDVELMFYNSFSNVSSFFKREFVQKKFIRYDENLISAEDYDFWRQFVTHGGKLAKMTDVLVYRRFHHTNSEKYYNAMIDNSLEIHKKMFSRFFIPTPEEIKFEYSIPEKCNLLKKIMTVNSQKPKMPQIYLENRYKAYCPADLENAYYLKHTINGWDGYLEKTSSERIVRISTGDVGKLVQKENDIIQIVWDKWPSEYFAKGENGVYYYMPDPEKTKTFQLKHINWADQFAIHMDYKEGCRMGARHECAKIKFVKDDILWIDWADSRWVSEEFKKNKNGEFEFVRELKETETVE